MAVHKRAYRPYDGPLTSERWRFLVLPRHSLLDMFESRALTAFFVLCFVPFLVEAGAIYVTNSPAARALLSISGQPDAVRPEFFLFAQTLQGLLAFGLTAWVAPLLVSPDLVNGALPLYLSRPFSRLEYVLGKASVLVVLLSAITWVPGLFLFGLQAGLSGREWLLAHLRVPWAILAGSAVWIAVLTLLGLAVSAAVRWRLVASGAVAAVLFMGVAFGQMWQEVLRNPWGRIANLPYLVGLVWRDLYLPGSSMRMVFDGARGRDLPTWAAWLGLGAASLLCAWLLSQRLRAREVVS